MLKIKLARFGKTKQPHYRIVINEDRDKRDGKYVAQVGRYIPAQVPKVLEIDVEAYQGWLKKGAQPTETVAALFTRFQSGNPFPPKKAQLSRKAKAKAQAQQKQKEEASAEAANAPAETQETEANEPVKATEAAVETQEVPQTASEK